MSSPYRPLPLAPPPQVYDPDWWRCGGCVDRACYAPYANRARVCELGCEPLFETDNPAKVVAR
jgi:hypothetical protein